MLLRDAIGGVLRQARERQGKTLTDVAGDGRLSVPYLSEIERGRKEASSEVIASVCIALGMDQSELLLRASTLLQAPRPVLDLTPRIRESSSELEIASIGTDSARVALAA
ncbi:helix-turn-helix domain-containing protein [Glaciibacter flavus]|uniref:helix-turn-helix domain-containing protein n=1 Tax=Orlajensenia flava TaxID=2565934 RepID=UPI003B0058A9